LGFAGSFHCAGMCGPIALSLPIIGLSNIKKYLAVMLYHSGRIITYITLGLIVSIIGRRFYVAGLQRIFSITAGSVILLIVLIQLLDRKTKSFLFTQKLFRAVQSSICYYWRKPYVLKFFLIGMLNGLLPCGMVYFALLGAAGFATTISGAFFMLAFGAGTLPMMLSVHFFGSKWLSLRVRNNLKNAVPVFIAFMGVMLVLRGLNLGIPFISPFIGKAQGDVISCH